MLNILVFSLMLVVVSYGQSGSQLPATKLGKLFSRMAQEPSLEKRGVMLQAELGDFTKLDAANEVPILVQYFKGSFDEYLSTKAGLILVNVAIFQSKSKTQVAALLIDIDNRVESGSEQQKRVAMHLMRIAGVSLTPRSLSAIVANMYDGDHETETIAIQTLGAALPVQDLTINALLTRMNYRNRQDLTTVIAALGATHTRSDLVIERLANELSNDNDYPKLAAAQALGEIGNSAKSRAESALTLLVSDGKVSEFTRVAAKNALARMHAEVPSPKQPSALPQ